MKYKILENSKTVHLLEACEPGEIYCGVDWASNGPVTSILVYFKNGNRWTYEFAEECKDRFYRMETIGPLEED